MNHAKAIRIGIAGLSLVLLGLLSAAVVSESVFFAGSPPSIAQSPLYIKEAVPPLNLLVLGKDHKIYYEAYNDAGDLTGDGLPDVGYKPAQIDYYGYFNSHACYEYVGDKFVPRSYTANKKCSGRWSGDFLNYLTTSRMDALRRVLYGGWRQVDTATETVLQGAFFPQDAHSWGKEYQSVARDGYNISEYAPLTAPDAGKYVLFAVTTVTGNANAFPNYQAPLFRVMHNVPFRVWNWLSIEGPVAGNKCFTASNQRVNCINAGSQPFPGHPGSRGAFNNIEATYAIADYRYGISTIDRIDCDTNCNLQGADDEYLTVITGTINIRDRGDYQFRIDGDDVIDFTLYENGTQIATAGCYSSGGRGFGACGGNEQTGLVDLRTNRTYTFKFRQEEGTGGDGYRLQWRKNDGGDQFGWRVMRRDGDDDGARGNGGFGGNLSAAFYDLTPPIPDGGIRRDYLVRVQACPDDPNLRQGDNTCKAYGGHFKPTGILHEYGETQKMYFGLITGTQANNLEGGVLRRNISNLASEIDPNTGVFRSDVNGIVNSISRLRMIGGGYAGGVADNSAGDANWNWANGTGVCPSVGNRAINNGECRMWGNPIAEMMYEGLRYFAGADRTPRFATGGQAQGVQEETTLGLQQETWKDPYKPVGEDGLGFPTCARPVQTVISDINPSYDGDVPGSAFSGAQTSTGSNTPTTISGFNAANEGQTIWTSEFGGSRSVFIGEVAGVTDGAPTAKTASSFGNIRGLSPEEPTKGGTYYSASVARFGYLNDVNLAAGEQKITTYAIALASPLPRIELPNGITLLPFAKTASGTFGDGGQANKPTNTIVDFYVQQYENFPGQTLNTSVNQGRPYAVFRINYEDVEQGNDHDMDVIVRYEIVGRADGGVDVNLTAEYAAGSADQNVGYVISGSNSDGVYLVVRDTDSPASSFRPYDLNTPPGVNPGGCRGITTGACGQQLPLTSTRTFRPAGGGTAIKLKDPLWFAAKYGGPVTSTGNPENYFLVTNPLNLRAQLKRAFDSISDANLDVGNASISGARVGNASFTLQPTYAVGRDGADWTGNLAAFAVNERGALGSTPIWDAASALATRTETSRNIRTITNVGAGTQSSRTAAEFRATNVTLNDFHSGIGVTGNIRDTYGDDYTLEEFVRYLRGDRSHEPLSGVTSDGRTLRERSSVLGDIINSEPEIASPRSNFGYGYYDDSMFSGYIGESGYLEDKAGRKTVAYVGANDGMLHAFDASTVPCAGDTSQTCAATGAGTELFAFIPNGVLGRLGQLPVPDASFQHRYFVDGQITVRDAKDGDGWKTLLVGSVGGGGRSVFVLDVSDPQNFGDDDVLWERNSKIDQDLGSVYGKPLLVPLENGDWGVLFGNGYGGNLSDPSLYVLDAFTGELISKITADDGNPASAAGNPITNWICSVTGMLCARKADPFNGLGQIAAIDKDGDGKVDFVYGGDLQGHLWKFDLSNADEDQWKVANGGNALFRTQRTQNADGQDQYQPITGGLRIAAGPGTGAMVYFGTGRYFVAGDNDLPATPQLQSLYGFFDNFVETGPLSTKSRADLVMQQVTAERSGAPTTRSISANPVFYYGADAKRGWYLDLKLSSAANGSGERFIATPLIENGRVFFSTYTPVGSSCDPGGVNFAYGLDLLSGTGALGNVKLQSTGTAACTNDDCGAVAILGKDGAPTRAPITSNSIAAITPEKFINPDCEVDPTRPECAGAAKFKECQVVIYPGAFVLPRPCGRQSWRQLR